MDIRTLYRVAIPELLRQVDPLSQEEWRARAITREEVFAAVDRSELETKVWNEFKIRPENENRDPVDFMPFHVRRIAYFVKNGLSADDQYPMNLYIDGAWKLVIREGRHRFAAVAVIGTGEIETCIDDDQHTGYLPKLLPSAVAVGKIYRTSYWGRATIRREI